MKVEQTKYHGYDSVIIKTDDGRIIEVNDEFINIWKSIEHFESGSWNYETLCHTDIPYDKIDAAHKK